MPCNMHTYTHECNLPEYKEIKKRKKKRKKEKERRHNDINDHNYVTNKPVWEQKSSFAVCVLVMCVVVVVVVRITT